MKAMGFIGLLIVVLAAPWFINAYKFAHCDFESSYKCEAMHGAGLIIPPLSFLTVWFDSDN